MAKIFISAGEASGDHYGAEFVRALRGLIAQRAEQGQVSPLRSPSPISGRDDSIAGRDGSGVGGVEFFGLGGVEMRASGFRALVDAESVAHMGITEVVLHAPGIWRKFRRLKRSLRDEKPALAVFIDFPDVNFRLAKEAKRLGIPVLWLVSPQLWAWKKRRLRWVQQRVTKMLVIFPFEEQFYRERGVEADFIGHPLADLPLPAVSREEFAAQHGLDAAKHWIALLPGSRTRELQWNLPAMLGAVKLLASPPYGSALDRGTRTVGADAGFYEFVLPVAATLSRAAVEAELNRAGIPGLPRITLVDDARAALYHARASIVASGTATVQAALIGNPFVIVYRMSGLSYALARRFVSVEFAGMPNLIAGREIVPELLQEEFTAGKVASALEPLLRAGPVRERQIADLHEVAMKLRRGEELPKAAVAADNGDTAGAMARAARAAFVLLTQ